MAVLSALLIIWTVTLAWLAGLVPGVFIAGLSTRGPLRRWTGWLLIAGVLAAEVLLSGLVPSDGGLGRAAMSGLTIGTFWGWWHGRFAFRARRVQRFRSCEADSLSPARLSLS